MDEDEKPSIGQGGPEGGTLAFRENVDDVVDDDDNDDDDIVVIFLLNIYILRILSHLRFGPVF